MPAAEGTVTSLAPSTTKPSLDEVTDVIGLRVQGLSQEQLNALAIKVYDLLLEELRIESERHGGIGRR
jgi:hypothetical protein